MSKGHAKKSENIDVRISYEAKRALYKKAKSEGRPVSDIIRELIDDYLYPSTKKSAVYTGKNKSRLFNILFRKPKAIIAIVLAAMATSLAFIPTATANDYLLSVEGEIMDIAIQDPASISSKRIETTILLSEGESFEYNAGKGTVSKFHTGMQPIPYQEHEASLNELTAPSDDLIVRVKVNHTVLSDNSNGVLITMSIIENKDGLETIIAEPALKVELDEVAEFAWGSEPGKTVSFKFIPSARP